MHNALDRPPVTLTAPGIFRGSLPVSPSPLAMEPVMENGVPVIEVTLGLTAGGKPVTIKVSSLDYLDGVLYHFQNARAKFVLWVQDHGTGPFGDDSDWLNVAESAGVTGTAAAA